jgi:hypothetical protein
MEALDLIALMGGGAEAVTGYLVLARHATVEGPDGGRLTAAGAFAIQKKAGLPRSKAEAVLDWLQTPAVQMADGSRLRFIAPADEARAQLGAGRVPEQFGPGKNNSKSTKVRWWLNPCTEPIYLANALVDGIGAGTQCPPLARIYLQSEPDFASGITMAEARLDTVMLLLHLYQNDRLEECGGVDPRSGLYREWKLAETPTELEFTSREPVMAVDGSNAALYEIEGTATTMIWTQFADKALAYISDDGEQHLRFWCAFHNLKRLGLVYEVLTVWNRSPLKSKTAELQYTLYIFDRHAREGEPYLQREIHAMAMELDEIDYADLVPDASNGGEPALLTSGRFRYIAIKKTGAYPLGVFRLRFRPKTRDTGLGIEAERRRCLLWANACRRIAGKPPMA